MAPGPSLSEAVVERVRGQKVGVVTSAYRICPWADFLAATDRRFWAVENPKFAGKKYTVHSHISGAEKITGPFARTDMNSGVLGLECARLLGATEIVMLGFDFHGTHYFGPYKNGLGNTAPHTRVKHQRQYLSWARRWLKTLRVINCTEGSQLKGIPLGSLDDYL